MIGLSVISESISKEQYVVVEGLFSIWVFCLHLFLGGVDLIWSGVLFWADAEEPSEDDLGCLSSEIITV